MSKENVEKILTYEDVDEILTYLERYIAKHSDMSVDNIVRRLCAAAGSLAASGGENPQELLRNATATLSQYFESTIKEIVNADCQFVEPPTEESKKTR